ncbi:MAG: HPr kinase/phosphorylase [bacterium]|nr:HPr kinase/phosphorylase [bacterium]
MKTFTVLDLLDLDLKEHDALELKCLSGRKGLVREIIVPELNRPGLALSGFYENFAEKRIQLIGREEFSYLLKLANEGREDTIQKLFSFNLPCCIFSHNLMPDKSFLEFSEKSNIPVLISTLSSSEISVRLIRLLSNFFAPQQTVHGVLVEVSGSGVLIKGNSGVGKSETALELIERGHRLVADDAVVIKCVSGNNLIGSGTNKVIGHHMEIRGLGIINISHIFGVGAIRDEKEIDFIVELEEWDSNQIYDRIGANESNIDILGVKVPCLKIPVKPGRNIPIIIETAAFNEKLKQKGQYSAREFNKNIIQWLESENARKVYLENNRK